MKERFFSFLNMLILRLLGNIGHRHCRSTFAMRWDCLLEFSRSIHSKINKNKRVTKTEYHEHSKTTLSSNVLEAKLTVRSNSFTAK